MTKELLCLAGHAPTSKAPYILLQDKKGYYLYNTNHAHDACSPKVIRYKHNHHANNPDDLSTYELAKKYLLDRQQAYARVVIKNQYKEYTLPAGTYYIGDSCYVIRDKWYDFLEAMYASYNTGTPGLFTVDGCQVFVGDTEHGDGVFAGSDGRMYYVDAGIIGIVPEALKSDTTDDNELSVEDYTKKITASGPVIVKYHKGGIFEFLYDNEKLVIYTDYTIIK